MSPFQLIHRWERAKTEPMFEIGLDEIGDEREAPFVIERCRKCLDHVCYCICERHYQFGYHHADAGGEGTAGQNTRATFAASDLVIRGAGRLST